mgnify:CR=1 FL=1
MQHHEGPPSGPEEKLNAFREEIRAWVAEESAKKQAWEERGRTGEAYDPHAEHINADHLTDEDAAIWKEIQDGTLTREHWDAYVQKSKEGVTTAPEAIQASRKFFMAFMANAAQAALIERELEDMKAKNTS